MYHKIHTFDCLIKPEEVCIFVTEIWAGCVFLNTHFLGFDLGFTAIFLGFFKPDKVCFLKYTRVNPAIILA